LLPALSDDFLSINFNPVLGGSFDYIARNGAPAFGFSGMTFPDPEIWTFRFGSDAFPVDFEEITGRFIQTSIALPVSEPGPIGLVLLGLAVIGLRASRRWAGAAKQSRPRERRT